jgi:hypothetical protein
MMKFDALSIRNVHAVSASSSMVIGVLRVTDIISLSLTLMNKFFYIRDYELLAIHKTNKSHLQSWIGPQFTNNFPISSALPALKSSNPDPSYYLKKA